MIQRLTSVAAMLILAASAASQPVGTPGEGGNPDPGGTEPGGSDPGTPPGTDPEETPATLDAAFDIATEGFQETGVFSFGAPLIWPATRPTACVSSPDPASHAITVLKFLHSHRLDEDPTDQEVMDLVVNDTVVGAQFFALSSGGPLTTDADDDLTTALNHVALIQNYGASGGATTSGAVLTSQGAGGPWCEAPQGGPTAPPTCSLTLGGRIFWNNGRDMSCRSGCDLFEEAVVYLTIVRPNGTIYRATTTSRRCDCPTSVPFGTPTTSGYTFPSVPLGYATVQARPLRRCCQVGTASREVACPPDPWTGLMCALANKVINVTMGPWTPPVYYGHVSNPGNSLTKVWLATEESACEEAGADYVTTQELPNPINYSFGSCLPSKTWLYATATGPGGVPYWAEQNVADQATCGQSTRVDLALTPAPCVEGDITNWTSCMAGRYVVTFTGCFAGSCNAGGMQTIDVWVGSNGHYHSGYMLKPGVWQVKLWHVPNPLYPNTRYPAANGVQFRLNVPDRCRTQNFRTSRGC